MKCSHTQCDGGECLGWSRWRHVKIVPNPQGGYSVVTKFMGIDIGYMTLMNVRAVSERRKVSNVEAIADAESIADALEKWISDQEPEKRTQKRRT